jgi:SAM-dependent methyltransferase
VSEPVAQAVYPLEVVICQDCAHLQLRHVVDPELLFRDYVYEAGTSPVFVAHFQRYAEAAIERFGLRPGDLVVEIGSNDGTLLRFFKEAGMRVLGIDPARGIARRAEERGIRTIPEFLDRDLARSVRSDHGEAKLVVANNVLAHIDDLAGVVAAIKDLLAADGVLVFEVSYALDVYEKTLFDTIYHEHLDYHAARPLVGFFERAGLPLFAAERVPTHGGSLRGFAGRGRAVEPSVQERLNEESAAAIDRPQTWRAWSEQIAARRDELVALLRRLKGEGRTVAGYGAPAKATTLMHHFGLGTESLDFIVDDSPLKQGLLAPGTHIPVLAAQALTDRRPDYLVVLAWNFADSIVERNSEYRDRGGRFIVPLPEVKLI